MYQTALPWPLFRQTQHKWFFIWDDVGTWWIHGHCVDFVRLPYFSCSLWARSDPQIMSVSVINLYSTEACRISTALHQIIIIIINSSITIVWNRCCWAPHHGDCPVASYRLSDLQQRRPDNQKCLAGNLVKLGDVDWLDVDGVNWEYPQLVYSSQQVLRGLVLLTAVHCVNATHHTASVMVIIELA